MSFAQQEFVSGSVTDTRGNTLQGVNVSVKGTTKSTQTDKEGKYVIETALNSILVFSYSGMKTTEQRATSVVLDVVLADAEPEDEEKVVTTARTATSIYGSSNPLWVLNGVILEDIANSI